MLHPVLPRELWSPRRFKVRFPDVASFAAASSLEASGAGAIIEVVGAGAGAPLRIGRLRRRGSPIPRRLGHQRRLPSGAGPQGTSAAPPPAREPEDGSHRPRRLRSMVLGSSPGSKARPDTKVRRRWEPKGRSGVELGTERGGQVSGCPGGGRLGGQVSGRKRPGTGRFGPFRAGTVLATPGAAQGLLERS